MQHTLNRTFERYSDAIAAVSALEAAGIPSDDISLVAPEQSTRPTLNDAINNGDVTHDVDLKKSEELGLGASVGAGIGATAGILAGIGSLAIPGVGPIVAAGWLLSGLTGAGVGALAGAGVGAMAGSGVDDDDHTHIRSALQGGHSVVSVRTASDHYATAERILNEHSSGTTPLPSNGVDPVSPAVVSTTPVVHHVGATGRTYTADEPGYKTTTVV